MCGSQYTDNRPSLIRVRGASMPIRDKSYELFDTMKTCVRISSWWCSVSTVNVTCGNFFNVAHAA